MLTGLSHRKSFFLVLPFTLFIGFSVAANTIEVTNANDAGLGSLREAVASAASNDTIVFNTSLNGDTIKLTTGQIILVKNLVILGNGETNTIIDGNLNGRIFHIPTGISTELKYMTLARGFLTGIFNGGGISNLGNTSISDVAIYGCTARWGGGIYNSGSLTITNAKLSENYADQGGGLYNSGSLTMTNANISGNSADIYGGGIRNFVGVATITNAIISGNISNRYGGGIFNFDGNMTFINVTISGNSADDSGGGLYVFSTGTVDIFNSIIWDNDAPTDPEVNSVGTQSYANSLVKDKMIGGFSGTEDPRFVAPVAGSLAPTTDGDYQLACGSPVENMGDDGANSSTEDLIGNPRKTGTIDLGAYERLAGVTKHTVITSMDNIFGSLRSMVRYACPGDTICFDPSLNGDTIKLTSGTILLNKNLVILGNGETNTIIDGNSTSRIFFIRIGRRVRLMNLTLSNGYSSNSGGGIHNLGFLAGVNITITGCESLDGGGVWNSGSTTMSNATISGNSASSSGGGIYSSGNVTLNTSSISGNSANSSGGIRNGNWMTISNSTIEGNSSTTSGGGITNLNQLTTTNTTISGNTAGSSGGGISHQNGLLRLTNGTVSNNIAGSSGGGIYNFDQSIILNVVISDNTAGLTGGGIFNFGQLNIRNSRITNNQAFNGGGLWNEGGLTSTHLTVSGNSANFGGGIINEGGLTVTNILVSGNAAAVSGGGIFALNGSLSMTNATISGNNAGDSGGALYVNSGTIDGYNSIVWGNQAPSDPEINASGGTQNYFNSLIKDHVLGGFNGTEDPLFVAPVAALLSPTTDGDYQLGCGSPVENMGDDGANSSTEDLIGNPRKTGTIDLGAYERLAGVTKHTVTTSLDNIFGSLRSVVGYACPGDTICFDPSINGDTIKISNSSVVLDKDLVFLGNGKQHTLLDGNNSNGILSVTPGSNVHISQMMITNGSTAFGGGIFNEGVLDISNICFARNTAFAGGALANLGTCTATKVEILGNSANAGGGVHNLGIFNAINVLISGNAASGNGGGVNNNGTINPINVTITANSAGTLGGGIHSFGGAIIANNTIVWGNGAPTDPEIHTNGGTLTYANTLVNGQVVGGFNGTEDPLFMAPVPATMAPTTTGDYRLSCGSSGADMGDDTANSTTEDLQGNPRKIGPIDLGPYERPGSPRKITVTNVQNEGIGSLREAIAYSCHGDTICFDPSINGNAIILTTGQMDLNKNLVIIGNGESNTIIDGNANDRIFDIPMGINVEMIRMTLTNGRTTGLIDGGAIFNNGMLSVDNLLVLDNTSRDGTGGIYNNGGTITISNSTISGNSSLNNGGGLRNEAGIMNISNSTISGNSAARGGGIYNNNGGELTISNSRITANEGNLGGGVFTRQLSTSTLINSIVSGNSATTTGGGFWSNNTSTVYLINSVVSGNLADEGGGIEISSSSIIDAHNSIIWGNEASADPEVNTFGTQLYSNTLVKDSMFGGFNGHEDPLFVAPVTASMAPTTAGDYRLTSCSPLINAGDTTGVSALIGTVDLDSMPRIFDGLIDLGAYEYQDIQSIPIAQCISVDTILLDEYMMGSRSVVDLDSLSSFDPCGIDTMFISQEEFNCTDIGLSDVVLTVVGNNGEVETCTTALTVIQGPEYCFDNMDNDCDAEIDESDPSGYCCANGTNPNFYIDLVRLAYPAANTLILNNSGPDVNGYGDYRDTPANATTSNVSQIYFSVKPGLSRTTYFRIWVDWDQDMEFDAFEMMAQRRTNNTWNGQFSVPAAYRNIPGQYYMRIIGSGRGYADDPCSEILRGEVEDYLICIANGCGTEAPVELSLPDPSVLTPELIKPDLESDYTLDVYPNPFSDHLTLDIDLDKSQSMDISILNQQGSVLLSRKEKGYAGVQSINIDLSHLVPGLYYVQIQSAGHTRLLKVVKM